MHCVRSIAWIGIKSSRVPSKYLLLQSAPRAALLPSEFALDPGRATRPPCLCLRLVPRSHGLPPSNNPSFSASAYVV